MQSYKDEIDKAIVRFSAEREKLLNKKAEIIKTYDERIRTFTDKANKERQLKTDPLDKEILKAEEELSFYKKMLVTYEKHENRNNISQVEGN